MGDRPDHEWDCPYIERDASFWEVGEPEDREDDREFLPGDEYE